MGSRASRGVHVREVSSRDAGVRGMGSRATVGSRFPDSGSQSRDTENSSRSADSPSAPKSPEGRSSKSPKTSETKPFSKDANKNEKKKAEPPIESAPEPKPQSKPAEQPEEEDEDAPKDVMISYNWGHQQTAFKIRDYLRDNSNLSVWIDTEKMSGDIYGKMAQAVFKSKIIIMCLSEKYELSDNCKFEYEYAAKKKKNFVPVMVQKDYEPRGGFSLDMILGSKLYYMLSEDNEFKENIPDVLKAIQEQLKKMN